MSKKSASKLPNKKAAKKASKPTSKKPAKITSKPFTAMVVPAPMADPFALLSDLQGQLSALFDKANPDDQPGVLKAMMEVSRFSTDLFQKKIDTNTEEWAEADKALKDAIEAVKAAQKEIDKTIETIKDVAKALEIAAKIAGFLA